MMEERSSNLEEIVIESTMELVINSLIIANKSM